MNVKERSASYETVLQYLLVSLLSFKPSVRERFRFREALKARETRDELGFLA